MDIDALIRQLRFRSPNERKAAAEALGNNGDPQAVPHLIQALGDKKWEVRKYAALALGNLGDPQAVEPLTHALNDSYEKVREAAAEALGKLGDKAAAEALPRFIIAHPHAVLAVPMTDRHSAEHLAQQHLHKQSNKNCVNNTGGRNDEQNR